MAILQRDQEALDFSSQSDGPWDYPCVGNGFQGWFTMVAVKRFCHYLTTKTLRIPLTESQVGGGSQRGTASRSRQ